MNEMDNNPDTSAQVPDFRCWVCGKQCPIAPDPPRRSVCEDHEYKYERVDRGHFCIHCFKPAPDDWYD
jgi:hypothetical protein